MNKILNLINIAEKLYKLECKSLNGDSGLKVVII